MIEIDKKRVVRNQTIVSFAALIKSCFYHTDWNMISDACGVSDILNQPQHERVRRAQFFGDDDYSSEIAKFLQAVFDADESIGQFMVHKIAEQTPSSFADQYGNVQLTTKERAELNQIMSSFESKSADVKLLLQSNPPSATDTAELSKTPFLSDKDISDARKMSELYIILHCYENSVRQLIRIVCEDKYGENWWEQIANSEMRNIVTSRKEKERKERWLSPRGNTSPLYYLEWGDLVKLIRKEQNLFLPYIGTLRFIENRFEELESLRNIVAHNGVLPSDDDLQRIIISFRDWCRQMGS